MSLAGNLEDLSLGDIMQIISLSQKFGVLTLASDRGRGRMVFSSGLVQGACVKGVEGHFDDLRSLVVGKGILDPAGFDACEARAADLGLSVEEMLRSEAILDIEHLNVLIREAVEAAVLEMFDWPSGDFSFDVRSEQEDGDPQLILRAGINAQYLAMEGMRQRDELDRGLVEDEAGTLDVDVVRGQVAAQLVEKVDENQLEPANHLVAAVLNKADEDVVEYEAEAIPSLVHSRPLIVVDPDVSVLEWVKVALKAEFQHVHVFQQADQGLTRIRQYLIRGELPVVMLSPEAEVDPLSGIQGLGDFVKRLKTQAIKLPIFGLVESEQQTPTALRGTLDGVLERPSGKQLRTLSGDALDVPARELSTALARQLAD